MNRTLAINLLLNTISSYNTVGVDSVKLEFPLDSVDFSREGNALVISSNDGSGSQALLNNYFAENETNTLPTLELQDGTIVSGVDFLADYEIDTAAGTLTTTNGLNSYSDDAGELISGVDKLGALSGENISTSSVASASSPLLVTASLGTTSGGSNPDEPPVLPDQEITGHDGDERFVFQPDAALSSKITLSIYNPTSGRLDVTSLQESEYVQSYKVNNDGTVTVTLTGKGIEAVRQGESFTFELSTIVDGHERNVNVIVNAPNDFTSADVDTSTGANNSISYEHHVMGETYSGNLVAGGSVRSDITVTTSGSDGVRKADIQGTRTTTVDITASGDASNGINAQAGEKNVLKDLGSVSIEAGQSGILTSGEGASNAIKNTDTLAVAGGRYGIESEGGGTHIANVKHITITGVQDALHSSNKGGVELGVEDVTITGRVYAENQGYNLFYLSGTDSGASSTLTIDGKNNEALYADGMHARSLIYGRSDNNVATINSDNSTAIYGTNDAYYVIDNMGTLAVTGGKHGIEMLNGASTSIYGAKHTEITGKNGDALHSEKGIIEFNSAHDISLHGRVFSDEKSKTSMTGDDKGTLSIDSTENEALYAKASSSNEIKGFKTISLTSDMGSAIYGEGGGASNNISEADTLTVKAGTSGIESNSGAETTISGVKTIDISSQEGKAIYANGDSSKVKITGAENGESSLTLSGGVVAAGENSSIEISNINDIAITTDQSPAMSAGSTGMVESQNFIQVNNADAVTLNSNGNTIENTDGGYIQVISDKVEITSTNGDAIHAESPSQDSQSKRIEVKSNINLNAQSAEVEGRVYSSNGSIIFASTEGTFTAHATDSDALFSERGGIHLSTQGDTTVISDKGSALHDKGLNYDLEAGLGTTIESSGNVTISGGTYGLESEDGGLVRVSSEKEVDITGKSGVALMAKGASGKYSEEEGYDPLYETTINVAGYSGLTLHGSVVATDKATVDIYSGKLEIEGYSTGDAINSDGGNVIVYSENEALIHGRVIASNGGDIQLSGQSSSSLSVDGKDTEALSSKDGSIVVNGYSEASLTSESNSAIYSSGALDIDEGKYNVDIHDINSLTAKGGTYGIKSVNGATTIINNVNHLEITGSSRGIETSDSAHVNITNSGDVLIHRGVAADDSGENTIDKADNVTIEGKTHEALHAQGGGSNSISTVAGDVTLTSDEYSTFAILADGEGSSNGISGVDGTLTIKGKGYGINTSNSAETNITDVDNVLIEGTAYSAIESDANAHVNITEVKNLTINGEVIAKDGSVNTISSSSAITVTITAHNGNGVNGEFALTATGGSQNIIEGHGTINIVGGITADANSANIIKTVAGETTIALNGKIDVSESIGLDIQKGEGWSKLVLTADSLDEFMGWYGEWLDKLAKNSDFANKIGVKGINIDLPDGMDAQLFEQWLNASGNQDVNDFYDLIKAFRAHGVDVTYKGETIPVPQEAMSLAEASTTSLLVASVDDTHDPHSAAKAEEDQTSAHSTALAEDSQATNHTVASVDDTHDSHSVAKAEEDQTSAHSTALAEDSQATNHTVASLDDNQTVAQSATLLADASHIDAHVMELVDFTSIEDVHLSDADETVQLVGGHYSHILDMGDGDDTLSIIDTDLTNGTILMGDGNDRLSLAGDITLDHTTIDGGSGYDVLELGNLSALHASDGSLDLSSLAESISGFEVLDLSGSSGKLHVDLGSLLKLGIDSADAIHYTLSTPAQDEDFDVHNLSAENTLVIKADSNESVSFDANWHDSGATVSDGGEEYTVYTTLYDESQYFILLQAGV